MLHAGEQHNSRQKMLVACCVFNLKYMFYQVKGKLSAMDRISCRQVCG